MLEVSSLFQSFKPSLLELIFWVNLIECLRLVISAFLCFLHMR